MSKFGWYQVPEPLENMGLFHQHDEAVPLKAKTWPVKNAVLDQEDLLKQGILCSQFIPGAANVDALGSCTANAFTSAASEILPEAEYLKLTGAKSYGDTKGLEEFAIRFYHGCTDQTREADEEWPPTDCGSSGPYIFRWAKHLGMAKSQKIAASASALVSLLQSGGVLTGKPFLNDWMNPPSSGIIDGNGSYATFCEQYNDGIAGGHETYIWSIEKLALSATGVVIPAETLLVERNSWTKSWGDEGNFLIHLSTYQYLMGYCDLRQFVAPLEADLKQL